MGNWQKDVRQPSVKPVGLAPGDDGRDDLPGPSNGGWAGAFYRLAGGRRRDEEKNRPRGTSQLRRTSSLPTSPSWNPTVAGLAPLLPPAPIPASTEEILANLPVDRRLRSQRSLKRGDGDVRAARVADWLANVAAPPPEESRPQAGAGARPAVQETAIPPTFCRDAPEAKPAINPTRSAPGEADFTPPRPAFLDQYRPSPSSSAAPKSPSGSPTVTRRVRLEPNSNTTSLDMPRTPTDRYSSTDPRSASHVTLTANQLYARSRFLPVTTPPSSLLPDLAAFPQPPRPPKKPSRMKDVTPRRSTSLDSLIDPRRPSTQLPATPSTSSDLDSPPPVDALVRGSAGAESLSTLSPPFPDSSYANEFALSSSAEDKLFFRLPSTTKPPPRPARSPYRVSTSNGGGQLAQHGIRRTPSLVKTSSLSRKKSTNSSGVWRDEGVGATAVSGDEGAKGDVGKPAGRVGEAREKTRVTRNRLLLSVKT